MKEQSGYIPPRYIPVGQSDLETSILDESPTENESISDVPVQWSSGICACFDDTQSSEWLSYPFLPFYKAKGCVGTICPCYLFGKNAEFLGSGTLMGSCTTHFLICGLMNAVCCLCTGGVLLGFPGCFAACYACGYRKALRTKYNLQEGPCGDFVTHLCCHLCAVCQEYREIRERSVEVNMVQVAAPAVQSMDLG